MAQKQVKIKCTSRCDKDYAKIGEPFTFKIDLTNDGSETIHVCKDIGSYTIIDDNTLEVSLVPPLIDESKAQLAFRRLPQTVPVHGGGQTTIDLNIKLPLRIGDWEGFPPRIVLKEWEPLGDLEIRPKMAFGKIPFYAPTDRNKLNEQLGKWTKEIQPSPFKIKIKK